MLPTHVGPLDITTFQGVSGAVDGTIQDPIAGLNTKKSMHVSMHGGKFFNAFLLNMLWI